MPNRKNEKKKILKTNILGNSWNWIFDWTLHLAN